MDVLFELTRVIVSTVSKRCASTILEVAATRPRFKPALIRVGNATNRVYVRLKYFSGQLLENNPGQPKVTLNVKPLEDEKALEVGADTVSDTIAMLLVLSFVFTGINLRRANAAAAAAEQRELQEYLTERVEQHSEQLQLLQQQLHELKTRLNTTP